MRSVVRVDPCLDMRPRFRKQAFKDGPVTYEDFHHLSHLRLSDSLPHLGKVTIFGVQGHKVS